MDKASSQGWVADVFEGCDTVVAVNNAELAVWQFLHHHCTCTTNTVIGAVRGKQVGRERMYDDGGTHDVRWVVYTD